MMKSAILALLLCGTTAAFAGEDPAPAAPLAARPVQPVAGVCIPVALLDRIATYQSRQPWSDVAQTMDMLRQVSPQQNGCQLSMPGLSPAKSGE